MSGAGGDPKKPEDEAAEKTEASVDQCVPVNIEQPAKPEDSDGQTV